MACESTTLHFSSYPPSLDWDLHDFEVLKAATSDFSMVMEPTKLLTSSSPPDSDSDLSTGYLEDVLVEWKKPCKRRRLLQQQCHDPVLSLDYVLQNYLDWGCTSYYPTQDFAFDCMSNIKDITSPQRDEHLNSSISSISDEENALLEMIKAPDQEALSASYETNNSASSYKELFKAKDTTDPTLSSSDGDQGHRRKKLISNGLVYPFAVVKPGGFEGDVTLNDINERILMPPTRPVRHPVGDFACHPCVSSPNGPGLSGKAVVAFTRIQTQGRGTITIIRTRG